VLHNGDQKRAKDYDETGLKLSIFEERDHGALLQIFGSGRDARQYEIGNPLTASKMTRYRLSAALYAPGVSDIVYATAGRVSGSINPAKLKPHTATDARSEKVRRPPRWSIA